jgi:hypothetical protein
VRVTVLAAIKDQELTAAIGRFLRKLRYRLKRAGFTCEHLLVHEWHDGQRHEHILIRTGGEVTRELVRELWQKALPGVRFTCHAAAVINPAGLARYIVKDIRDNGKKELPPEHFRGRVYSYSRDFFTKRVVELWREQRAVWFGSDATANTRRE